MSKEDCKDDSTSVTAITQETDMDQLCQKDNALLFSISTNSFREPLQANLQVEAKVPVETNFLFEGPS